MTVSIQDKAQDLVSEVCDERNLTNNRRLYSYDEALKSYGDQRFIEGATAMRKRAAKECDQMGAYEQEGFGLNRGAQNYFRARNAIRALDPNQLKDTDHG